RVIRGGRFVEFRRRRLGRGGRCGRLVGVTRVGRRRGRTAAPKQGDDESERKPSGDNVGSDSICHGNLAIHQTSLRAPRGTYWTGKNTRQSAELRPSSRCMAAGLCEGKASPPFPSQPARVQKQRS